jgi:C-terminal processing protease CtpA/Prc
LKKREKINKRGRLFVAIGRGTFSSAYDNAQTLREYTKAIIIGEPSGQKPNSYGEVKTFVLPNSNLEIGYSTMFWKSVDGDPLSMMPDISVEVSFNDYVVGRDVVLEKILAYKP